MHFRTIVRSYVFTLLAVSAIGCSKDEEKRPEPVAAAAAKPAESPAAAALPAATATSTAAAMAAKNSDKPLREKIQGTWKFDPTGNPEFSKDPALLAEARKLSLTVTSDAIKTADGKKDSYKVVKEDGKNLTVKVNNKKDETYAFKDDDTIAIKDPEMGEIVFKRAN